MCQEQRRSWPEGVDMFQACVVEDLEAGFVSRGKTRPRRVASGSRRARVSRASLTWPV